MTSEQLQDLSDAVVSRVRIETQGKAGIRSKAKSEDPRLFAPGINIARNLETNIQSYRESGDGRDAHLSMTKIPKIVRDGLDRVRASVPVQTREKPGREITAACCIVHGLKALDTPEDRSSA